jgi:RND superfamily putative drug exporter
MSHALDARPQSRPASGDWLATALRRWRWPVVIVWVIAVVALFPLAQSLDSVANGSASANLPSSASSTRVAELAQTPGQPDVDAATVVFARTTGLTAADLAAVASARAAVARLAGHGSGLGAPGQPQRSADGRADAFTANVTTPAASQTSTDTSVVRAIRQAISGQAGHGLQVAVTGSAALVADTGVSNGALNTLLLTALVIVMVILIIVYRSPLLWVLPLLGALEGIVVAEAASHGLANAGLTVSTLSAAILRVLVLGASTDYALLLIHRYREELRHHATACDAMAVALRRTLPTLLASAATVICAMACLLAAQSAALHGLGPVGAVSIAASLLAQVTFLPALLLIIGRAAFWPIVPRPGQPGREVSRLWSSIGRRAGAHPAPVALAAVVLLGAAAIGLAALHIDNNPLSEAKGQPGSVTGASLLTEHYGPGVNEPLDLLVPPARATAAAAAARASHDITTVTTAAPLHQYAHYSVTLSVPPYSTSGYAAVASLRQRLDRAAPGSLVGGDPATQYDITQAAHSDTLLLIPLILAITTVIIGLLLRAVVAPLVLVATTALSFAASFGLSSLLWRYAFGYPGIEAQLPMYIFIFLVALGIDYNIFLAARIREDSRHLGIRHGTQHALGVTGGVITAAGLVMAATFATLSRLAYLSVAEVGIAVALGVLLDTLLVRTILVPASLLTIGDRVWWPSRDRGERSGTVRFTPRPARPARWR